LGQGAKSGYTLTSVGAVPVGGANTTYLTNAVPSTLNTTGVKAFCGVEDNVVRYITPSGGSVAYAVCIGATYLVMGQ